MTALIAALNHVPAPFSNAASRIARVFRIFVESFAEAQAQARAARKRWPFIE